VVSLLETTNPDCPGCGLDPDVTKRVIGRMHHILADAIGVLVGGDIDPSDVQDTRTEKPAPPTVCAAKNSAPASTGAKAVRNGSPAWSDRFSSARISRSTTGVLPSRWVLSPLRVCAAAIWQNRAEFFSLHPRLTRLGETHRA